MAQSYQTTSVTMIKPGAIVDVKVQSPNSGLSTTGILMLVGEADSGPDVSSETDITENGYGPDALASVIAKYGSGNIVDAFRVAAAAANDPNIQGAPSRIFISKTNISTKASGTLQRAGLASSYGVLADKNYGASGNLINAAVISGTAEVAPTTGSFTYIPTPSTSSLNMRINGGANLPVTVSAKMPPSTLVGSVMDAATASLSGPLVSGLNVTMATGGVNRAVLGATTVADARTVALAVPSGANITLTISSGAWEVTPSVGDTLIIPQTGTYGSVTVSPFDGAGAANRGAYVVTAATSSVISATKLRNDVAGVLVNPVPVGASDILAVNDFICYSPIVLQNMTGTERSVLTGLVAQTVVGTASGQSMTLTLQTGAQWAALPQVGDNLLIPASAPATWRGGSNVNVGWYQVTAATTGVGAGASTIVMTRLSNGTPASFIATAIAAVTDLRVLRPAIDGVGKGLEVFDGGGTELITTQLFNLSSTPVTWVSTAAVPAILLSASETSNTLTVGRQSDALSEAITGPSDVVLRVGYHGGGVSTVTGSMTISGTTLTTTVANGNGAPLSINLLNYRTLGDLATYINTQTGYVCSVASTLFGQQLLTYQDPITLAYRTVLDKGTWGIASHNIGAAATVSPAGRVKKDAYALWVKISNSLLSQLGTVSAPAGAGQPEVQSLFFLSGGAKGSTSNANVVTAIDAMEKIRGNFLVPLFSRDASLDSADSLTDATSTYTIDYINASAKTHVLALSTTKRRRNRQAMLSKKTTFTAAKLAANNLASARCSMTFQDFKTTDSTGTLRQYQPWMGAVYAAAMQAAGFYKPIVKKFMNTSGVLMADGTYSDQLDSQVEDALLNGLLPAERAETGGFRWVSDQTTYAVDNNFVYNSIQAVYVADTIALTIAQRMENAFVGQSLADLSAGLMLSFLTAIMIDIKRLHLTTSSDDAALGFKNATVRISGPAAEVSLNIKLAGALYFIPITAYISQVTQTASQ